MLRFVQHTGKRYVEGEGFRYRFSNRKNDFLCLFVESPTEQEIKHLCKQFDIKEKHFKHHEADTRAMRHSLNPLIFSYMDHSIDKTGKLFMSKLLFVIKENILILSVPTKIPYYTELFDEIVERMKQKHITRTTHVLYEFLYHDSKENYDVIEQLDDMIEELEIKILKHHMDEREVMSEILRMKRHLIEMNKSLWSSAKIIFTIKKDLTGLHLTKEQMGLLDDIYDTLMHQVDMIETQKETVTEFLEIMTTTISNKLSITSNELNIVMKKMTALTIIIMVPTLIAGIYGMNFKYFPELQLPFGYPLAIGIMILASIGVYYNFHRKGWI